MHRRPGRAVACENQTEQADDLAPIVGNPGSAPAGAAAAISSPNKYSRHRSQSHSACRQAMWDRFCQSLLRPLATCQLAHSLAVLDMS